MKNRLTFIIMFSLMNIAVTTAQTDDPPVVDYESTAGRNDHLNPILKSSNSERRKLENEKLDLERKVMKLRERAQSLKANRQVKDLRQGIGVGYPITDELLHEFVTMIEQAKPNGKKVGAIYEVNGKEVRELYDVYITDPEITPWLSTRDVHEMWNKMPCDREKRRFYMSQKAWFRVSGELNKIIESTILNKTQSLNHE